MTKHDIVFEDLHGAEENDSATVELDADADNTGVTRFANDDAGNENVSVDIDGGDDAIQPTGQDDKESKDGYSKKVKARIARATRGEKKAKGEADYWKQKAVDAAKEAAELKKTTAESAIETYGTSIEAAEAELEAAFDDGDSKKQAQITSKLGQLRADQTKAQFEVDNWEEPDVDDFSPEDATITPAPDDDQQKLVGDWMKEQDDWYGAKGFERHTRATNRIDKEVYADGFDPATPEYYEELSKRIGTKFPELFDDDTAGDEHADDDETRKGDTVVAPVSGSESAASKKRSSSSRVELNADDFANMRRFGLDTNDPSVLKEYAANKREADRSALRQ